LCILHTGCSAGAEDGLLDAHLIGLLLLIIDDHSSLMAAADLSCLGKSSSTG
jgi:hypothetical protein